MIRALHIDHTTAAVAKHPEGLKWRKRYHPVTGIRTIYLGNESCPLCHLPDKGRWQDKEFIRHIDECVLWETFSAWYDAPSRDAIMLIWNGSENYEVKRRKLMTLK